MVIEFQALASCLDKGPVVALGGIVKSIEVELVRLVRHLEAVSRSEP